MLEGATPPTDADLDEIFASLDTGRTGDGGGMSTAAKVGLGAGAAALGAMGLKAAMTPGGLMPKLAAFGSQLNALRQQAMLSGLALPKSILGGVGASVANSLERKSLAPLAELFSGETARDVGRAFRAGRSVGPNVTAELPAGLDLPGRAMGAFDEAIQKSLVRSGNTPEEATRAMLQAPLPPGLSESMENPLMKFVQPFRRTPFNQFIEGGRAAGEHPIISTGYGLAGAAQGAAESDEQYPLGAGIGIAASGKYGFPQAIGQLAGRVLAKGKGGGGIVGSALPVSEYGITQTVTDPLRPFNKPALISMLEKAGLIQKRKY